MLCIVIFTIFADRITNNKTIETMKKSIIASLLIVVLSIFGERAFAYDFSQENSDGVTIYYSYINDGQELAVSQSGADYSGIVKIPETVTFMNHTRKVTMIGIRAFNRCGKLSEVVLPPSIQIIEDYAFFGCSFTAINIPEGVVSIGSFAFSQCSKLKSVVIPESVTIINECAFSNCHELSSVKLNEGLKQISSGAFRYCNYLTTITIPSSVIKIGTEVFQDVTLTKVVSLITEPFKINIETFSNNTFYNATLMVPKGTIEKYKATEGWNKFTYIEEISSSGDMPGGQKCAKPTISVIDGKLSFSCETEGVEYHYSISNSNPASGVGNDVPFSQTFTIKVYATKSGYENSDTATAEINATVGLNGDANGDGVVDAADVVKVTNIIMGE